MHILICKYACIFLLKDVAPDNQLPLFWTSRIQFFVQHGLSVSFWLLSLYGDVSF